MLNTYEQQLQLVHRSLASMKNDGKYTTFKYARKAMYDYLWHKVPTLMECRGQVYDNITKELVQAAPRKSFNYLERGWWSTVAMNAQVEMYKKVNGFMACATMHNNELVVSTTGTTTSEYAKWARELIERDYKLYDSVITEDASTLFEVVVPQDPHIVHEREGLHLLGWREKSNSLFHPNGKPIVCTLGEALQIARQDKGEGFMVYPVGNHNQCCKIKTPYYSGKKKLMRMTAKNVELMYTQMRTVENSLPEMWKFAPSFITSNVRKERWLEMSDQQRRKFLEYIQ
jgi:hypothetical protein